MFIRNCNAGIFLASCESGEIGRRTGLRIQLWQQNGSSNLPFRTRYYQNQLEVLGIKACTCFIRKEIYGSYYRRHQ